MIVETCQIQSIKDRPGNISIHLPPLLHRHPAYCLMIAMKYYTQDVE